VATGHKGVASAILYAESIATIDFVSLSSNNNHENTDMSGIPDMSSNVVSFRHSS
jgi:hypothetical protein